MVKGGLTVKNIYVPASCAGSTGTIFTQSGIDVGNFRGDVHFVLSAQTSSTAGATDKVDVVLQTATASAHGDASWADVTNGAYIRNVTGSFQCITINSNDLKRFVRLKATATGTFVIGLSAIGEVT